MDRNRNYLVDHWYATYQQSWVRFYRYNFWSCLLDLYRCYRHLLYYSLPKTYDVRSLLDFIIAFSFVLFLFRWVGVQNYFLLFSKSFTCMYLFPISLSLVSLSGRLFVFQVIWLCWIYSWMNFRLLLKQIFPQSLQTQLVPSDLPLVKIPERLPSSSLIDFNPVKSVPSLSDGSSDLLGR